MEKFEQKVTVTSRKNSDFECFDKPLHSLDTNKSIKKQKKFRVIISRSHVQMVKSDVCNVLKREYYERFGLDDVVWFVDKLIKIESNLSNYFNSHEANKLFLMTKRTKRRFELSTNCWSCEQPWTLLCLLADKNGKFYVKVRDHFHLTGTFREQGLMSVILKLDSLSLVL